MLISFTIHNYCCGKAMNYTQVLYQGTIKFEDTIYVHNYNQKKEYRQIVILWFFLLRMRKFKNKLFHFIYVLSMQVLRCIYTIATPIGDYVRATRRLRGINLKTTRRLCECYAASTRVLRECYAASTLLVYGVYSITTRVYITMYKKINKINSIGIIKRQLMRIDDFK